MEGLCKAVADRQGLTLRDGPVESGHNDINTAFLTFVVQRTRASFPGNTKKGTIGSSLDIGRLVGDGQYKQGQLGTS